MSKYAADLWDSKMTCSWRKLRGHLKANKTWLTWQQEQKNTQGRAPEMLTEHTRRGPPILDLGLVTQWEPEIQVLADGTGEGSSWSREWWKRQRAEGPTSCPHSVGEMEELKAPRCSPHPLS